ALLGEDLADLAAAGALRDLDGDLAGPLALVVLRCRAAAEEGEVREQPAQAPHGDEPAGDDHGDGDEDRAPAHHRAAAAPAPPGAELGHLLVHVVRLGQHVVGEGGVVLAVLVVVEGVVLEVGAGGLVPSGGVPVTVTVARPFIRGGSTHRCVLRVGPAGAWPGASCPPLSARPAARSRARRPAPTGG